MAPYATGQGSSIDLGWAPQGVEHRTGVVDVDAGRLGAAAEEHLDGRLRRAIRSAAEIEAGADAHADAAVVTEIGAADADAESRAARAITSCRPHEPVGDPEPVVAV